MPFALTGGAKAGGPAGTAVVAFAAGTGAFVATELAPSVLVAVELVETAGIEGNPERCAGAGSGREGMGGTWASALNPASNITGSNQSMKIFRFIVLEKFC